MEFWGSGKKGNKGVACQKNWIIPSLTIPISLKPSSSVFLKPSYLHHGKKLYRPISFIKNNLWDFHWQNIFVQKLGINGHASQSGADLSISSGDRKL